MKTPLLARSLQLLCGVLLCASVQAQDDAFSPEALVQYPTTGWPTNGGDIYNRRFSPLTQITKENVGTLKGVWRTHLNGSGMGPRHSGEATTLVHDGIAYVITGDDDVFALNIDTGAIV